MSEAKMKGWAWPLAKAEDTTVNKAHVISYSYHLVMPSFSVLQKGTLFVPFSAENPLEL